MWLKFSDGTTQQADPIAETDAELMQMIQNIASSQENPLVHSRRHILIWIWIC